MGETPILHPGDDYEYSSGTPLNTSSGFMTGIFQMLHASGHRFVVRVPTFALDIPDYRGAVHLNFCVDVIYRDCTCVKVFKYTITQ